MCGIMGVVGNPEATHLVIEGLKRLEYRGYDSAGVAVSADGGIAIRRATGKVATLESLMLSQPFSGSISTAIGHTRWATHGEPSDVNAHPHFVESCAVVHNGIIENYLELKDQLTAEGFTFKSETDTEVIPALISKFYRHTHDFHQALRQTLQQLRGAFALGIVLKDNPHILYATRRGSPLLIGLGQGHNYMASDALALAPFTTEVMYLMNDDIAILTPEKVEVFDATGRAAVRPTKTVNPQDLSMGKNGYSTFMLKEIHEQPATLAHTLNAYMTGNHKDLKLPPLGFSLTEVDSIRIIACGTSYHAAIVAKYWLEFFAKVPVSVDIASEFRYRQPPLTPHGLSIFISQSGETADTIAALELAKDAGQKILSIVNVPESSIDRESHASLYTKAGAEIGVASTKAFTSQLLVLAILAVEMAEAKGQYSATQARTRLQQLIELPNHATTMLELDSQIQALAHDLISATSALFIGRGVLYPIAMEGALKLKEISYIHAEGMAAGELKHGSIALVDDNMPVICLAPMNDLFEKTLSNLKEIQARKGKVMVFTDPEGAAAMRGQFDRVVVMPQVPAFTQPLVYTIPLQLLAYHTATLRGCDVDKPRNLAKSVTVE